MSLASTADATGSAIASALNALPKGEDQSEEAWKIVCNQLASWIAAQAKATLPASSVVTTGGPATQTGPEAPIPLDIA